MSLVELPEDTLIEIFNYVAGKPYPERVGAASQVVGYHGRVAAVREVYRLGGVCRRFHELITNCWARLPRPSIGLRIRGLSYLVSAPPAKWKKVDGVKKRVHAPPTREIGDDYRRQRLVTLYVYGGTTRNMGENYTRCCPISFINENVHPNRIETNLTIEGVVFSDKFIDSLMEMDLSKVEEVHVRDVLGVDMREPRERLVEFLDAFENVLEITFTASAELPLLNEIFDFLPESGDYWERTDEEYDADELKEILQSTRPENRKEKFHRFLKLLRARTTVTRGEKRMATLKLENGGGDVKRARAHEGEDGVSSSQ